MRLEILVTAALFFGGTYLSGVCLRRILRQNTYGIFTTVLAGVMLWWAVMELVLVPMTIMRASYKAFLVIYSVLVGCFGLVGLIFWQDILEDMKNLIRAWKQYVTPGHLVALALILYQLIYIHHHMYLEWDDDYYVNLANVAGFEDKIYWVYPETGMYASFDVRYIFSLWPIFYAWLSEVIGVSPTIMAHTILPWLMIPLAYLVYGLIAKELFREDGQMQGMFLTFAVLLHLFMSGEHTAGLTFLSITPWVGKGLWATVLMPALFYWILRIVRTDHPGDWILLGMAGLGGSLLSSMGIMLMPVFVGIAVLALSIQKKNIRFLLKGAAACIPCVILGICYIVLPHIKLY